MRIVHLQRAKGIGGSERHLLTLLPGLRARAHEVIMIVLAVGEGERFASELRRHDLDVVVLPMRGHADPLLHVRLTRTLRRIKPDLCHTHLFHADVYGQVATRSCGIRGVSTIHGASQPFSQEPTRAIAAATGRLAARKIAISEHLAAFVERHGLAPSERVRVIPYGLDMKEWKAAPSTRKGGEPTVLVASRLIPGKGHDFLIRAFHKALRDAPNLRLRIAGDGPLRDQLERLVSSLRVAERVEFLGFVKDVASLIRDSDVVAFPTLPSCGEGFGLIALEAMALERPVLGTTVGAIPEVVVDGETGLLVEPGDIAGLAAGLVQLAADGGLRHRLGKRGRERAESRFDRDSMVDRTLAVYEEALA